MVFLIQNTQNSDTKALQLKLDELVCAIQEASDKVLDLEELDEKELDAIRKVYLRKAEDARRKEDAEKAQKKTKISSARNFPRKHFCLSVRASTFPYSFPAANELFYPCR